MTTPTINLAQVLACRDGIEQVDSEIAVVAVDWFARWLRTRSEMALLMGNPDVAEALSKTAFALTETE